MREPETASEPRQIIVTGTAGKASIATMIAALLHARGERVLRVNGHWLHSRAEQVEANGTPLDGQALEAIGFDGLPTSDDDVEALVRRLLEHHAWDWVVVSGINPPTHPSALTVVAPVLPGAGETAADRISALLEAAPRSPMIVSAPQRESVLDILRPYAREASAELAEVAEACRLARERSDLDGQGFRLKTPEAEYRLRLPVLGTFQTENAAAAILAVERAVAGVAGSELLNPANARTALESIRLPGRCDVIKRRPLIIVDAATTAASIRRLVETLQEYIRGRRLQILIDIDGGLPASETVPLLATLQPEVIAAGVAGSSSWSETCSDAGVPFQRTASVISALEPVVESAEPNDAVIVLGSRSAVATARAHVLALLPPGIRLN